MAVTYVYLAELKSPKESSSITFAIGMVNKGKEKPLSA